jgi:FkbM family methyltransferase
MLGRGAAFKVLGEDRFERLRARRIARRIRAGDLRDDNIDLLPHLVSEGDTVADVGANYGQYSFHLAQLVGPAGRVYAFEPFPSTRAALERIVSRLGIDDRVQIVPKAVGAEPGAIRIAMPLRDDGTTDSGRAWVVPDGQEPPGDQQVSELQRTTLDQELAGADRVTFLKIDVEGSDLLALQGAARTIERDRPVLLIEVARDGLARHGQTPKQVQDLLDSYGYVTFGYEGQELEPVPAGQANGDVLAVPADRADALRAAVAASARPHATAPR